MLPGFIARIDDLVARLTTEGTGMYWYLMLIYSNRWEDWGKQQLDALCLSFSLVLSIDSLIANLPCMSCTVCICMLYIVIYIIYTYIVCCVRVCL